MRNFPTRLKEHLKSEATTVCYIIKIVAKDGTTIGLTTLDKTINYDDGAGLLTYYAPVAFQPASIVENMNLEVNATEFESLVVPEYDLNLDEFDINSGKWDYASFIMYLINYEDLTMGHGIVSSGHLGEAKTYDGIQFFGELRSLADLFKRSIVTLYSLSCRARFGSQRGEEKYPCLFNADSLWEDGIIEEVGVENARVFKDSLREKEESNFYKPGLIQFLTGQNAGKYIEVEESQTDGTIGLLFELPYSLAVGDTYRIRVDCNKIARDEKKGCKKFYGDQWGLHFRGEPDMPIQDEIQLTTPQIAKNKNLFELARDYAEERDNNND